MPEVQFLAITTGPYEAIAKAAVRSNSELYDFLKKMAALDGVISTHTFLMLDILKNSESLTDTGSVKTCADE
jgi:DNA-binding Lrp family transcriptional regulator